MVAGEPSGAERIRQLTDELAKTRRELASTQARLDRIADHPLWHVYEGMRNAPGIRQLLAPSRRRRDQRDELLTSAAAAAAPTLRSVPPSDADRDAFEARVTWIFGTGRSGSTWFLNLLGSHSDVVPMHEPWLGHHLAPYALFMHSPDDPDDFFSWMRRTFRDDPDYFFSMEFSDRWRPLLRELILQRLEDHVDYARPLRRSADPDLRLLIREPNASWAAETIIGLLPRSRMIFLVRDGRDVLDSLIDGYQPGGWLSERTPRVSVTAEKRAYFMESHATAWVETMEAVQRAFDAHRQEDRLLVRYEELLGDTPRVLNGVLRWLGLEASVKLVDEIVARHAFAGVPEDQKGRRRPKRAATPGLWREHFTANEQMRVERLMGAKLSQLGYGPGTNRVEGPARRTVPGA